MSYDKITLRLPYECDNCGVYFKVDFADVSEVSLMPNALRCFNGDCNGLIVRQDKVNNSAFEILTVKEIVAASFGFGMPLERRCAKDRVEKALVGKKIEKLDLEAIPGTNRTILHYIDLEDGARVYIGSSTKGACVYRIQEAPNGGR